MITTKHRWSNPVQREDGVLIRALFLPGRDSSQAFEIVPRPGAAAVKTCPCCDNPFKTVRAAQLCADMMFPPSEIQ